MQASAGAAPVHALSPAARLRLWAEVLVLFVGAPLAMALLMPPRWIYPTIGGLLAIGVVLLALTPGWRWRRLIEGPVLKHWPFILVFTIGAALLVALLVVQLVPHRWLELPLRRPDIWRMVMLGYPIFLVIPQEILFRPLFFERYDALFPNAYTAIAVNSGLFGLAHLFYWNAPAVVLTTLGSIFFAIAYREYKSFPLAWLLHTIGGLLIFTLGLGIFFYHGAIGR